MGEPENKFPTIRDYRDRLDDLVRAGLGDHPVQVLIVPGSTMLVVAKITAPDVVLDKIPLMIELGVGRSERIPVSLVSTEYLKEPSQRQ